MALLLSCQDIGKSFGARALFDRLRLSVEEGDRIGLVGPNGAGKSTLLQIFAGMIPPDHGTVSARKALRLGYVAQSPTFESEATVEQLAAAVQTTGRTDAVERTAHYRTTLSRVGFQNIDVPTGQLSGGWKKRLAIALALIAEPELLLLDEPTNHLDSEGIVWLEKLLTSAPFASLTVSHDRYLLENVANRIVEVNRVYPDGLLRADGNYSSFLEKRELFLEAQNRYQESLRNKVRREVEWLRQGAKARTTKSKARIQEAGRLVTELGDLSARTGSRNASIDFSATGRASKRLIEAIGISKKLGHNTLFQDLSLVISPGVRTGVLGPNGSGKTTFLRILAGELAPDTGEVRRADGLRVVYFDQIREQLDLAKSLRRELAPDSDSVIFREKAVHVAAYASRFLFRSDQLDLAVARLSGGERARVLIAKLMLRPADVLMLDEPTNDLDIPTLELLEDSLLDFPGAVVLVTHDRYLLDRVSTTIVGLDGVGGTQLFADCAQWEEEMARRKRDSEREKSVGDKRGGTPSVKPVMKKLSYLENREWETIESRIEDAERRLVEAQTELENPDGMSDRIVAQSRYDALVSARQAVDELYARWAELEAKLAG